MFLGQKHSPVAREKVRTHYQDQCSYLRDDAPPVGEDREPCPRPCWDPLKPTNSERRKPARLLHFKDLLTNHDEEHHSKHHTCHDQHALVGHTVITEKAQESQDAGEQNAHQRTIEDDGIAKLKPVAL